MSVGVSRIRKCKQGDRSEREGPKVRSASINQELQGDWNIISRWNIKNFQDWSWGMKIKNNFVF